MTDLNARLLAAHAAGDHAGLVALYSEAADTAGDPGAAAFFLTHSHVFALEIDHPQAAALRQRLIAQGREAPLPDFNPPFR